MVPTCLPGALRKSWTQDVPLEYWIMQSELGLRGVVVFVDQSCDDGFRRADRELAMFRTGCVSMSRGR